MKRWTTLAAAALAAPALATGPAVAAYAAPTQTTVAATTATAAALTPGGAVARQLAGKGNVKIVNSSRIALSEKELKGGLTLPKQITTGVLGYGGGKVNAADFTTRVSISPEVRAELKALDGDLEELFRPTQVIVVNGVGYRNSEFLAKYLPTGKTWISSPIGDDPFWSPATENVDALSPATLDAVLKSAKKGAGGTLDGVKTTLYQVKSPLRDLAKISPEMKNLWVALDDKKSTSTATVKVWVGPDQLPRRVMTSIVQKSGKNSFVTTTSTMFSEWRKPVAITAPDPSLVIDADQVALPLFLDEAPLSLDPKRGL
ncbi:hypothetical protein SAMN05421505_11718 [Sinosporangium album]|uniref:Lipoprotein LprG n=1 Tax=Sinosporangium album TaxID=504805 RepID=A0A1G8CWY0_9ACTN|nr:hypothetical protein [Sinosporangium album]SDH50008.1 hypothetical protein SAMN05421505_11718 [Sinosporangium album]